MKIYREKLLLERYRAILKVITISVSWGRTSYHHQNHHRVPVTRHSFNHSSILSWVRYLDVPPACHILSGCFICPQFVPILSSSLRFSPLLLKLCSSFWLLCLPTSRLKMLPSTPHKNLISVVSVFVCLLY